jgi:hypothetical protein
VGHRLSPNLVAQLGSSLLPMAKPTGWSTDSAVPPNIGEQHQESYQVSAQRPRRRWRPSGRTPGPSSGVLSLLATIAAASSTADGSPLTVPLTPPSFLCPFIEHDSCYANTDTSSSASTAKRASVVLPPTPAKSKRKVVQIADKFEKDSDGKWRKVDAYTLYGSTICLVNSLLFNHNFPVVSNVVSMLAKLPVFWYS